MDAAGEIAPLDTQGEMNSNAISLCPPALSISSSEALRHTNGKWANWGSRQTKQTETQRAGKLQLGWVRAPSLGEGLAASNQLDTSEWASAICHQLRGQPEESSRRGVELIWPPLRYSVGESQFAMCALQFFSHRAWFPFLDSSSLSVSCHIHWSVFIYYFSLSSCLFPSFIVLTLI